MAAAGVRTDDTTQHTNLQHDDHTDTHSYRVVEEHLELQPLLATPQGSPAHAMPCCKR